ncbi:MAG: hypothetical protein KJ737_05410 [Proteobacteria bacterium]|nr:hypothetical protein [Pseudomonadota bacterium]
MNFLLAIDSGLKTGLAMYGRDGRLIWYRSQHFASPPRLKKAVYGIMNEAPSLSLIIIEGGGHLADIWKKEAERRQIKILQINAETWRRDLLYQREQRGHKKAKLNACLLARKVIEWSGTPRPTSLRHDAAEAILTGLWGVHHIGWIKKLPPGIQKIF